MSAESVALIPECAECEALSWLLTRSAGVRYLGCDEHFDEPPEVVFYCPDVR